jgi:hypothetical protein
MKIALSKISPALFVSVRKSPKKNLRLFKKLKRPSDTATVLGGPHPERRALRSSYVAAAAFTA